MFLFLFRRVIWRGFLWSAKHACRLFYRNANLQALILTPLVMLLLILPATFNRSDHKRSEPSRPAASNVSYSADFYERSPSFQSER
ncbi:hypothetical protein HG15A2_26460 [Adhaeretor mobilis]|uniref:Uncharacterized protein n=1 Tax=Adhaeretor mobilis TaxID=1930276 RepID=A0A517MWR6_9BACT|nr:hypothetical protein HG15A2_26460 [Adhaeretor mobilis]